jgi:tetratricopeptide (TPR) repeat protein/predicted Ser/Thr protein kinase
MDPAGARYARAVQDRIGCPAPDVLDAFVQGGLDLPQVEAVERHLDACSECGRLVAELAWAYGASGVDRAVTGEPLPGDTQPAMSATAAPGHGTTMGRYLVLERLGAGGMGVVYAAYDPDLDRKVALKLLHGTAGDEERQRLLREAQAMARLAHPNVVTVHDVCPVGERLFIAMEFVDGQTLGAWLRERKRSWREIVEVLLPCAHGLVAAHQAGIVHRDFKPDNVLIGKDGRVRVSDFGLARPSADGRGWAAEASGAISAAEPLLTRAGALVGTPAYMSPEQFRGHGADTRSDQFGFCVTAYEALFGVRPFAGKNVVELADSVAAGRVREPPKSNVPRWLKQLVLRGLAVDPAARHDGMAAIARVLETRRRAGRRWIAAATFVGGTALGVAGLHWATTGLLLPCEDDTEALAGAWSDQRKLSLVEGLAAVPSSFAKDTAERVGTELDDYANGWIDMRREACQATHVRHEQSDELFDRRISCLDRRRARLHALVDALLANREATIEHALDAVGTLPQLEDCADVDRLQAEVAAPDDPQLRATVETLRLELDAIAALDATGQSREGLTRAQALDVRARAIDYRPLVAEVALQLGRLYGDAGQYEQSAEHLERAHMVARASSHDVVAASAIVDLVDAVGYDLVRLDEGRRWARLAEADVERVADPVLRASLWAKRADLEGAAGNHRVSLELDRLAYAMIKGVKPDDALTISAGLRRIGSDHFRLGEYALALESGERALAVAEPLLGSDHPALASWLKVVGNALYMLGRNDEARVTYQRAVALIEAAHGREHPDVAGMLNNLANTMKSDPTAALALQREALGIYERTLGADHPDLTDTLNNIAHSLEDKGELREALPFLERSMKIAEGRFGPDHPDVADALNHVGRVRQELGEPALALHLHGRVLAIRREHLGERNPQVGVALHNIAQDLDALGRTTEARTHYQQALVVIETALGPDHSGVATVCTNFGNHLRKHGEPDAAREQHERALAIQRKLYGAKNERTAGSHYNLGQALVDLARCDEARPHFEAAIAVFTDKGDTAKLALAREGLDRCRAPMSVAPAPAP